MIKYQDLIDSISNLEDIPTYCHLFPAAGLIEAGWRPDISVCGVPRSEQAPHGGGNGNTDRCPNCGKPRCPQCRKFYYS
jgi:hypothetical protein